MENRLTTSLLGLNALVCGSTSGIGFATAQELAFLGANITLFSRDENKQYQMQYLHRNDEDYVPASGGFL